MLTSENCDSFIDATINIALHELLRITSSLFCGLLVIIPTFEGSRYQNPLCKGIKMNPNYLTYYTAMKFLHKKY